jgi:hypothetical protein
MSLSRFGVMNVSAASVSLARSCVKALLGVPHGVFFAEALHVRGARGRSLPEQFARVL